MGLMLGNRLTAKPAHRPAVVELTAAFPVGSTNAVSATVHQASPAAAAAAAPPPPAAPARPPVAASSNSFTATLASWYGGKPEACYDAGRRNPLPAGITMWAASRTLRCGTTVEISGPAGTTRMLIEDHGPWLLPGRDLDLSPTAFTSVAGSLSTGVVTVRYRVVG